ncbi:FliM/FliN family flagellar motor switch protein [Aliiroseovarius sp. 2305UL8-7]|uniref:FliM/FliN family flagellar motor switch protein n=1 Tax=Aliiroseovarius conchicola TaxID=3121637 RepID=UPI003529B568
MADTEKISAMRQKAGLRVPAPEIAPVTATSALGNSVVRAGEDIGGLVLAAETITQQRCVRGALRELLPERGLLALVEGPESRFGLIAVDHELVAALIEIQTIGRLLDAVAVERSATKTDATMCADFIDRVLECLEGALAEAGLPEVSAISGYRFAVRLDDLRAAHMALDDIPYRCFQTSFKLGDGSRSGGFTMLLPFDTEPAHDTQEKAIAATGQSAPEVVLTSATELHAVLHQTRMSLADVTGLEEGMIVTLPRAALGAVSLVDLSGRTVARCRLGRAQGNRALRIGQHQAALPIADDEDAEGPLVQMMPPSLSADVPPNPVTDALPAADQVLDEPA